jgi:hypothetical protein
MEWSIGCMCRGKSRCKAFVVYTNMQEGNHETIWTGIVDTPAFPFISSIVLWSRILNIFGICSVRSTSIPNDIYVWVIKWHRSWDSIVGIATGYGLDDREVRVQVPVGSRIFSSPRHSDRSTPALGSTQPPIQWVPGALSPGVKRPGREDAHSAPASAEVKKMWIYTSTPPYVFMA